MSCWHHPLPLHDPFTTREVHYSSVKLRFPLIKREGKMKPYRLISFVALCATISLTALGISSTTATQTQTPEKLPEIQPRRAECAMLLPERGEKNDVAKLIRAEQFLRCERDGFPKTLAPPWATSDEGIKKLGDACEYFNSQSRKDYSQVGAENLQLARARCFMNVASLTLRVLQRDMTK